MTIQLENGSMVYMVLDAWIFYTLWLNIHRLELATVPVLVHYFPHKCLKHGAANLAHPGK